MYIITCASIGTDVVVSMFFCLCMLGGCFNHVQISQFRGEEKKSGAGSLLTLSAALEAVLFALEEPLGRHIDVAIELHTYVYIVCKLF